MSLGDGHIYPAFWTDHSASFDLCGNKLSSIDASNAITTNTYDAAGRLLTSTDPMGCETVHTYDGLGREISNYKTDGSSIVGYSTCDVDAFGNAVAEKAYLTSDGTTSSAVVDKVTKHAFDPMGREMTVADCTAAGRPAVSWHDASGNTVRSWQAGLSATQCVDPAFSTRAAFDAEGRTLSESAPGSNPDVKTYNADGSVKTDISPDQVTIAYGYDAGGRDICESKTSTSGVTVTRRAYDLGGELISSWDENGVETDFTYDLDGHQLTAQQSGQPASVSTYNPLGFLLSTTDADGIVTSHVYDITGRVLEDNLNGEKTDRSYDRDSRVLNQSNPDGSATLDRYDTFGRAVEETQTNLAGPVKHVLNSYDSMSRETTSTDTCSSVTTGLQYPPAMTVGPTIQTISYGGLSTRVVLDSVGNESARLTDGLMNCVHTVDATDCAGRATSWTMGGLNVLTSYDAAGRMAREWGSQGVFSGSTAATSYVYGLDGRKYADHLGLVTAAGGSVDSTYTYTTDGRLQSVAGLGAGSFQYDAAGNVATFTASTSAGATSGVLAYDSSGRLNSRSVNGGVCESYGYDPAQGYRTSQRRVGSNESSVTYTYTGRNELLTYSKPAGALGSSSCTTASYTYDATGQRVHSRVTSSLATATTSTDTTWTYSGLSLLTLSAAQSGAASATWQISYLYDGAGRAYAGIYSSSLASPTLFGMVTNDRGDVVALTDSSGTSFASYRYDPWGRPLSAQTSSGSSIAATLATSIESRQPLRYAGYCYDMESGLYCCSARHYDPATMQWLQKDSAKADGAGSAHQYVRDDPVDFTDVSGRNRHCTKEYFKAATNSWFLVPANDAPGVLRIWEDAAINVDLKIHWSAPSPGMTGASRAQVWARAKYEYAVDLDAGDSWFTVDAQIRRPNGSRYWTNLLPRTYPTVSPMSAPSGYPNWSYATTNECSGMGGYWSYWVVKVRLRAYASTRPNGSAAGWGSDDKQWDFYNPYGKVRPYVKPPTASGSTGGYGGSVVH